MGQHVAMPQKTTPTLRKRRLAQSLKRLREERGLSAQDAARRLRCTHSKISLMESGQRGLSELDFEVLLRYYKPTPAERKLIKNLYANRNKVDWFSHQEPLFHEELRDYLILEADAGLDRSFESSVIPGLLQSEGYVRKIFQTTHEYGAEDVQKQVEIRMGRKERLEDQSDFKIHSVIDASVLHHLQGGPPDPALEQLEYLYEISKQQNVTVQLLHRDVAVPPGQYTPFHVFSLTGAPVMDIVWSEHLTGGIILEQARDVERYVRAWEMLQTAALSPSDSRKYIQNLAKGIQA